VRESAVSENQSQTRDFEQGRWARLTAISWIACPTEIPWRRLGESYVDRLPDPEPLGQRPKRQRTDVASPRLERVVLGLEQLRHPLGRAEVALRGHARFAVDPRRLDQVPVVAALLALPHQPGWHPNKGTT